MASPLLMRVLDLLHEWLEYGSGYDEPVEIISTEKEQEDIKEMERSVQEIQNQEEKESFATNEMSLSSIPRNLAKRKLKRTCEYCHPVNIQFQRISVGYHNWCKRRCKPCCKANNASCLACAQGMSVNKYCRKYPCTDGCRRPKPKPYPQYL